MQQLQEVHIPTNVLAIGAHPDDIELGCGGTLVRHVSNGDDVTMLVVTHGEAGPGEVAGRQQEQERASQMLGVDRLVWANLPDGRVSNHELALVHVIEQTIRSHDIEVVYSHSDRDSHQDHRAIAAATWGAARHCRHVLMYDSPSSHEFTPTVFVDIGDTLEKKIAALECHLSQVASSRMADSNLVRTQAGYRGFQARVSAAEGYMVHRMLLDF